MGLVKQDDGWRPPGEVWAKMELLSTGAAHGHAVACAQGHRWPLEPTRMTSSWSAQLLSPSR